MTHSTTAPSSKLNFSFHEFKQKSSSVFNQVFPCRSSKSNPIFSFNSILKSPSQEYLVGNEALSYIEDNSSSRKSKFVCSMNRLSASSWAITLRDVKNVRNLRQKLPFEGYPFQRLQINQTGDGLVNAAIAGVALAAAGANPIVAGILPFGIRATELIVAAVWNQRMASERREARIAATHIHDELGPSDQPSPGLAKKKSAQQIMESTKYDFIAGLATLGALSLLVVGGPAWGIIGLGVTVALCQTLSKFKEMGWSALRYVVNEDQALRQQQVDLQEPISAYEMALNVGIMTFSYLVGFGTILVIYTFAAPVALPVTISMAILGTILMVAAKKGFNKEKLEGIEEHNLMQQKQIHAQKWQECADHLHSISKDATKPVQVPINLHIDIRHDWSLLELLELYKACHSNALPIKENIEKQLKKFLDDQQTAYRVFDLANQEEQLVKRDKVRKEISRFQENIRAQERQIDHLKMNILE